MKKRSDRSYERQFQRWLERHESERAMIDRRGFLARLLGTAAGAVVLGSVDLDKLLWVPGERTYFDLWSDRPGLSTDWIVKEALRLLEGQLQIVNLFNRTYDVGINATRMGDSIVVRQRVKVANRTCGVEVFTSDHISKQDYSRRYLEPAVSALAESARTQVFVEHRPGDLT
jgi:hypothetical protein